jgi:hypothetical protein
MKYRAEIDGLRALAVLPVILFHAGFETFSGGFVGVDVFFVISGYLITTIILAELEKGSFSLVNFYERRARRILPALFLVMFECIPLAWMLLNENEYKDYSQSLLSVVFFASNILFWLKSGYFDTAAELKPLLHTWSLAVEEQYYLLFPLFLMFFWRFGKHWMLVTVGALFVASLAFAQWAVLTYPAAAFYLLPSRGWELLMGAIVAFYLPKANQNDFGRVAREVYGGLGIALIVYSVFVFNKSTPFPGFYALVPTLGAALILSFANQTTAVGKFIGNRAFVGIGLLSYGAYLWHQPLFVFARHLELSRQSNTIFLVLTGLTFILAYISWKFVEAPFRSKQKVNRSQIFKFAVIGSSLLAVLGCYGYKGNEIFDRLGDAEKRISNMFIQNRSVVNEPSSERVVPVDNVALKLTDRNFIVIGDSHARHLVPGLSSITTGTVQDAHFPTCLPFRNIDVSNIWSAPGNCVREINNRLDKIMRDDPEAVIILSSMGPVYLDGVSSKGRIEGRVSRLVVELITDKSISDRYEVYKIGLRQTLWELSKLSKARVVFSFDVPELGIDFGCNPAHKDPSMGTSVARDWLSNKDIEACSVSRAEYDERVAAYKKLALSVLSDFPNVGVFDPADFFCDRKSCKGFDLRHGFLYWDPDHLSDSGSRFYAENFVKFLARQ